MPRFAFRPVIQFDGGEQVPRLQRRYLQMVQEHMKSANRNAAGPALKPGENQAFSATQAAWRFLSNRNVGLRELVEPLREVGCQAAHQSESESMLLAHDWCKIDYKTHTSRQDLRQITHEHDICYEMSTSMLIDGSGRASIAPMQMDLKTGKAVHSTAIDPSPIDAHRLDELAPTMAEAQQWVLDRKIVHGMDREILFEPCGEASYHGKTVARKSPKQKSFCIAHTANS